jgi:hypothetical protein
VPEPPVEGAEATQEPEDQGARIDALNARIDALVAKFDKGAAKPEPEAVPDYGKLVNNPPDEPAS